MSKKKKSYPIESTDIEGLGTVSKGRLVSHPIFGNGKVLGVAKWESGDITVNVEFDNYGSKWLAPEFAKLSEQKIHPASKPKGNFFRRFFGRNDT